MQDKETHMNHCCCCNETLDPKINEAGDGRTCTTCLNELSKDERHTLECELEAFHSNHEEDRFFNNEE
jgi:hypothetical protein